MLNRGWIFAMVFFLCNSNAVSAFTVSDLQEHLGNTAFVRGDFTQTKELAMLNDPLISKGIFVRHETKGLLWQQMSPFSVILILSDKQVIQKIQGQKKEVLLAKENPLPFYFSTLFLDLFTGNTRALSSQFSMQLKGHEKAWSLTLTPKKSPLNKVFKYIVLSGAEQIQHFILQEQRGDKTRIDFKNVTKTPALLTQEEHRAFED